MNSPSNSTSKLITLTLNGFHGFQSHNVRALFTPAKLLNKWGEEVGDGYDVEIAESAARKFACRAKGCTCGEGVPTLFECDQYDFEHKQITLNGNYPQR